LRTRREEAKISPVTAWQYTSPCQQIDCAEQQRAHCVNQIVFELVK